MHMLLICYTRRYPSTPSTVASNAGRRYTATTPLSLPEGSESPPRTPKRFTKTKNLFRRVLRCLCACMPTAAENKFQEPLVIYAYTGT